MIEIKDIDYSKPQPCGVCGQLVLLTQIHTYEDCLKYKKALREKKEGEK